MISGLKGCQIMAELTELEVREMIRKAREGDAEANYRMSEWALDQAMAEPEEERWNRLAAKCLVKAAEAGYSPAQKRMEELIRQLEAEEDPAPAEEAYEKGEPQPRQYSERQPAEKRSGSFSLQTVTDGAAALWAKIAGFFSGLMNKSDGEDEGRGASHRSGGKNGGIAAFFNFSEWDEAKWKKAQRIVIIVCAVLVALLIIILFAGRGDKDKEAGEEAQIPVAETAEPIQPTPTPYVELYPSEAIRTAIESSNLDVTPDEGDYVTEAATATVSTSGSDLNMRRGTASTYGQIATIPNGTSVSVYAYKSNWALVSYGGNYGWCSSEYLK